MQEQAVLEARLKSYSGKLENVGKFVECGVNLIPGSEARWRSYPLGDLVTELQEMVQVGMSASDAVVASTSRSVDPLGVGHLVRSLAVGKRADLLIVDGDPTRDNGALRNIDTVIRRSQIVLGQDSPT